MTVLDVLAGSEAHPYAPGLAAVSAETLAAQGAEAHLVALGGDGAVRARCSLWWTHAPRHAGAPAGALGHYAALDDEAAAVLLGEACARLRVEGCHAALGPLDGSTWRPYRFVTERAPKGGAAAPPFFLEPDHPAAYPAQWVRAGFAPTEHYHSAAGLLAPAEALPLPEGVALRPFDAACPDGDLRALHALALRAFAQNPYFTPISEVEFVAMYGALLPAVPPELVVLAERGGALVGVALGVPDLLERARGGVETFVLKTLAVAPEEEGRGLGRALLAHAHARAYGLGFRRVVHALMHGENRSARLSTRAGAASVIRRYALFARAL